MRPTTSIIVVLSAALFALAATQATALEEQSKRHALKAHHKVLHLTAVASTPARVCEWVGPGGRAVYRCHDVAMVDSAPTATPAQRTCDWVGPGGRAVYRCQ